MNRVIELRNNGTVGNVIAHLRNTRLPQLPDSVERLEQGLDAVAPGSEEAMPRALREVQRLHGVRYTEIIELTKYLEGHSPFETKHGVKGAEFENVLVVVGRGWNRHDFNQMLEFAQNEDDIPKNQREKFTDNRNLFYVVCSRPKKRLSILFTQKLSEGAMQTVRNWFGAENVEPLIL